MITRRHILHLGGYEPADPAGLRHRLGREFAKCAKAGNLALEQTDIDMDPDGVAARWRITARGPEGEVAVTYEILRWDEMVRRESGAPVLRLFPRVMATGAANILNGVARRLFRASWRFGVAYLWQYAAFTLAVGAPLLLGWAVAAAASRFAGLPALGGFALALAVAAAALPATLAYARRRAVMQMSSAWVWAHDWACGRRPDFEARVDTFAGRVVAAAKAGEADEIILIGHSCGGVASIPVMARALALDPDLARRGPRLALLSLGSAFPILMHHPGAGFAREAVRRVHAAPEIAWVEVSALKDPLGCYRFDPPAAAGLQPRAGHPVIWGVHLRRMMGHEKYARHRLDFIRLHYRYVVANDAPYPYDFPAIVLGSRGLKSRAIEAVASHAAGKG